MSVVPHKRVEVVYPVAEGRLVLRSEVDWERDIEPVSQAATGAWFEVPMPGDRVALKVCLRVGLEVRSCQGPAYVVSAHDPDAQIYPYFDASRRARVSDVLRVAGPNGAYGVRIYHPPGYDENTLRRYPVLYMHDGQNLFFPEEAFAGNEWQVDETMNRLDEMNAIRKAIVVGVSPPDRMEAYTSPGYLAYGTFMAKRLKPLIDGALRTRTDAASNIVMGSSLGGVAALALAWSHPQVFGRAACLSSTFGYDDDLYHRVAQQPKAPIRIYLDSGWPNDNYDATNSMRDLLVARGFRLGDDLLHFAFPDGLHTERSWALRVHVPFQYFLGRAWVARG